MENKKQNWSERELARMHRAQEKDREDIEAGKGLSKDELMSDLGSSLDAKYIKDNFGLPKEEDLKESGREEKKGWINNIVW